MTQHPLAKKTTNRLDTVKAWHAWSLVADQAGLLMQVATANALGLSPHTVLFLAETLVRATLATVLGLEYDGLDAKLDLMVREHIVTVFGLEMLREVDEHLATHEIQTLPQNRDRDLVAVYAGNPMQRMRAAEAASFSRIADAIEAQHERDLARGTLHLFRAHVATFSADPELEPRCADACGLDPLDPGVRKQTMGPTDV